MSSTNRTTKYGLSQFVGPDKPAWLTDYNQDMAKIDAGIDAAQDTATGADGKADANTTAIGDLTYLATSAKNNLVAAINEVNSDADTAQNTANTANNTATNANTLANELATSFNLNVHNDLIATCDYGTIIQNNMKIARSSNGKICKIYGQISIENIAASRDITVTLSGTGLLPSSQFNIDPIGIRLYVRTNGTSDTQTCPGTFNADGTVTITFPTYTDCLLQRLILLPTITFVEDFGD